MRTVLLSVLGTSMVAIVAYGVGHWTGNDSGRSTTRSSASPEPDSNQRHGSTPDGASASRLAAMQRALLAAAAASAPGAAPGSAPPPEASDPVADEPPAEPRELTDEEAASKEKERLQLWYQSLEDRFASQAVDSGFRRETEGNLREALSSIGSDAVRVESMDCRSDICKTSLRHESPKIDKAFMLGVVTRTPRGFEQHFRYEQGRTTIYTIRQHRSASSPDSHRPESGDEAE